VTSTAFTLIENKTKQLSARKIFKKQLNNQTNTPCDGFLEKKAKGEHSLLPARLLLSSEKSCS
jgi:hypothetical protein